MNPETEREMLPRLIQGGLRWSQRLLLIAGTLTIGYVGFTLLDAQVYQASAKRTLQRRIQLEKVQPGIRPEPAIKIGDTLGRLDVPRLGMSVAILQGTSSRLLRFGAGHMEGTPLPGKSGNSAIAGHRDTFFRGLKDIRANDEIRFQSATELSRYEVDWIKIVGPDDLSVLVPSTGSELTLVTCYPFYFVGPAAKRFVVRAHKY